jgi:8-oxo-dGTP pyrophosphatase MutT (NUDIX family)
MELGEDRDAAIRRETLEETGIVLEDMEYFRAVGVRYGTHDILYHMYRVRLDRRPDVRINPEEHKSYIWRSPEAALLEPLMQDEDVCLKLFYEIGYISDAGTEAVPANRE